MARHVDDYIDDKDQPHVLRDFLHWARLPAICKYPGTDIKHVPDDLREYVWRKPEPVLYADYNRKRVRVTMASRLGDVGITSKLDGKRGYENRVMLHQLSNFSDQRHPQHAVG